MKSLRLHSSRRNSKMELPPNRASELTPPAPTRRPEVLRTEPPGACEIGCAKHKAKHDGAGANEPNLPLVRGAVVVIGGIDTQPQWFCRSRPISEVAKRSQANRAAGRRARWAADRQGAARLSGSEEAKSLLRRDDANVAVLVDRKNESSGQTPKRSAAGFTLIEILFATFITALLVVVIAAMANQAMKTNESIVGDAMRSTDAEFILETVVADLEGLVFSEKQQGEVLVYEPELIAGVRTGRLMLLSATTDNDPGNFNGAPRAVSYRIAHQNPIDGGNTDPVHSLYRAVADAEATLLHATGLSDLEGEFWTSHASAPDPIDARQFVATNIVDFDVRFRVRRISPGGIIGNWEWTDRDDRVSITTEGAVVLAAGQTSAPADVIWEVDTAEVRLMVITPRGSTLLHAGSLPLNEVVERFGRAHLRRTAAFAAGG